MNQIESFPDKHPLQKDFDIRLIKHRAGRITLRLAAPNLIANLQLGGLANIFDYATRVAGNAIIGDCFIAECEMGIRTHTASKELIVSTTLTNLNQHLATFQCEIHGISQRSKFLIAEAHGTLVKIKMELSGVA